MRRLCNRLRSRTVGEALVPTVPGVLEVSRVCRLGTGGLGWMVTRPLLAGRESLSGKAVREMENTLTLSPLAVNFVDL